jgi:death-on-curing protein
VNPVFLNLEEVLAFHADQIKRYGGATGIRDMNMLQSALAAPSASFGGAFLHEDVFAMAAAYLFHIAENHPFVDGNKRTGTAAMLTFLAVNGCKVTAGIEELEKLVLSVAEGKTGKIEIASFLRKHSTGPKRLGRPAQPK